MLKVSQYFVSCPSVGSVGLRYSLYRNLEASCVEGAEMNKFTSYFAIEVLGCLLIYIGTWKLQVLNVSK